MKKLAFLAIFIAYSTNVKSQIDGRYLLGLTKATNTEMATVISPTEASVLYNTDEEHAYLNTSTGFKKILLEDATLSGLWTTSGNSGITATNFIGTVDLNDLIFKTNNIERINIKATGKIGINTDTPKAQLDIESDDVPLRIKPNSSTPTGTDNGQLFMGDDGILYAYDSGRGKWLSIDRSLLNYESIVTALNAVYIGASGVRVPRDATITGITVQSGSILGTPWSVEVRKNGLTGNLLTLGISSIESGKHDSNVNIDVNEGDYLRIYINGALVVLPQALIEIAWRK
ncbi:hypothetical protein KO500_01165 [Cellulophaga baltica]|uniref:hypothetical protein n=1 Tax=Cellulophaga TaxID=104264 RepID=UPI001C0708C1|nr:MULTISPECIES: hypothetical protein [Cellulophaga]MBU2995018.1 hypothetical protein [Cellulophaga baltica]MDO6766413.1 hypothetical protein [Cellulophaga sp. 1_MG-2023]